jgi:hypothetical protein
MFLTFLRHGSVAALVIGVAVEALAFLFGWIKPSLALILLGALLFYLSEYGMHRFAFHAPPMPWPWLRKMQHRLHYDHHVEPSRLDLLFLPIWFLAPNLAITTALIALIFGAEASLSALFGIMLAILHYEWGALRGPRSLPAAHPIGALDQAISFASSLHQRETLVRRQQPDAGWRVRHVPWTERGGQEYDDA